MSYQPSHNGGTALSFPQLPVPVQVLSYLAPRNMTQIRLPQPQKPLVQSAQSYAVSNSPFVLPRGLGTATARGSRTPAGCESSPNVGRRKPRAVEGEQIL